MIRLDYTYVYLQSNTHRQLSRHTAIVYLKHINVFVVTNVPMSVHVYASSTYMHTDNCKMHVRIIVCQCACVAFM